MGNKVSSELSKASEIQEYQRVFQPLLKQITQFLSIHEELINTLMSMEKMNQKKMDSIKQLPMSIDVSNELDPKAVQKIVDLEVREDMSMPDQVYEDFLKNAQSSGITVETVQQMSKELRAKLPIATKAIQFLRNMENQLLGKGGSRSATKQISDLMKSMEKEVVIAKECLENLRLVDHLLAGRMKFIHRYPEYLQYTKQNYSFDSTNLSDHLKELLNLDVMSKSRCDDKTINVSQLVQWANVQPEKTFISYADAQQFTACVWKKILRSLTKITVDSSDILPLLRSGGQQGGKARVVDELQPATLISD